MPPTHLLTQVCLGLFQGLLLSARGATQIFNKAVQISHQLLLGL
jgi:hypothetical protein